MINRILVIFFIIFSSFNQFAFATDGLPATASTKGKGSIVDDRESPYNLNNKKTIQGSINISVKELGNRWSQIQNIDDVNVISEFTYENSHYKIIINKAMPRHPFGKYTTFFGVAYHEEINGDTFIGTSELPKLTPDIALWGWAEIIRDNKVIAKMAPAHVKVMSSPPLKGIILEVDTESKGLMEVPNGYLTVFWSKIDSLNMPETQEKQRERIGWIVLIIMNTGFLWLAVKEK